MDNGHEAKRELDLKELAQAAGGNDSFAMLMEKMKEMTGKPGTTEAEEYMKHIKEIQEKLKQDPYYNPEQDTLMLYLQDFMGQNNQYFNNK